MTITDSTITDNVAAAGGAGAIYAGAPAGGGVSNTVFAGNLPRACLGPVAGNGGNYGGPGQAGCGLTPQRIPSSVRWPTTAARPSRSCPARPARCSTC